MAVKRQTGESKLDASLFSSGVIFGGMRSSIFQAVFVMRGDGYTTVFTVGQ
jgi:hypothetical protein